MGDKVTYVPQQKQVYGEYIKKETPLDQLNLKELFKSKDLNNGIHAALNDTDAAQIANNLADMEIDVKKK